VPRQKPIDEIRDNYKIIMCRYYEIKGGCANKECTFAHSQKELEKYKKMQLDKKLFEK
jgi:hypothetical protein